MSGYVLYFVRPEGSPTDRHELEGDCLADAKMSAAILYAGAAFSSDAPSAYIILGPDADVVYRFPEFSLARPLPLGG